MDHVAINDIFDRISSILKNDQKFSTTKVGELIASCINETAAVDAYFTAYPPLIDIAELGAALAYEGSSHHHAVLEQIKYKLGELRKILPDAA